MKKSQLRQIIRESINQLLTEQTPENPFTNPPTGASQLGNITGPLWAQAASMWDAWMVNQSNFPQPSLQFINNMASKSCNAKDNRLAHLLTKYVDKGLPPGITSTGSTVGDYTTPVAGVGSDVGGVWFRNPLWQSQMLSKISWLSNDITNNCQ